MRGHEFAHLTRKVTRHYRAADDDTWVAGKNWYPMALLVCEHAAEEYSQSVEHVTVALAHLSPRLPWSKNLDALHRLLRGEDKPVAMLQRSWGAAVRALQSTDPMSTFGRRADKTRSFAQAILGDETAVPIDIWTARVLGVPYEFVRSRSGYAAAEDAFWRAARRVDDTPRDVQAITWVQIRGKAE